MLVPWPPRKPFCVCKCSFRHHQPVVDLSHLHLIFLELPCPHSVFFNCLNIHNSLVLMLICQSLLDRKSCHTFLSWFIFVAASLSLLMDSNRGASLMPLSDISSSKSFAFFYNAWIRSLILPSMFGSEL